MITQVFLPEETLIHRAIEVLMTELGPMETTRFLNLPRQHYMDSVALHRQWQAGLDRDRFFDQVFREQGEYEYRTE